uniref:HTH_Tnp_Tc3_1 domain-containing protein n=1 Tax=Heterorhabditis bacteriophora TaxID=37862 RepID=A0A1I7WRC7_HETBA
MDIACLYFMFRYRNFLYCTPKSTKHERGQIKALSTAGYTVKHIADVVKRSRKVIMNFLRHQGEYVRTTDTSVQEQKALLGQNIHEMRLGKDTTFTSRLK